MKHTFYHNNYIVVFHSALRRITVNKNGHNSQLCPFPSVIIGLKEVYPVVFNSGGFTE